MNPSGRRCYVQFDRGIEQGIAIPAPGTGWADVPRQHQDGAVAVPDDYAAIMRCRRHRRSRAVLKFANVAPVPGSRSLTSTSRAGHTVIIH